LDKKAFMDEIRCSYYTYHKDIEYYEKDKDKLLAEAIHQELVRRIGGDYEKT